MAFGTGDHRDQEDSKTLEAGQSISNYRVFKAGRQEPACRTSQ
jgi:hypothetical protein